MAAQLQSNEIPKLKCEAGDTVIVTGFGPFKNHVINASWEAVKLLPSTGIEKELSISLILEEIPVAYEEVEKKVPSLWNSHKPMLVIHVGVSHLAEKITLETVACKSGYDKCDIYGQTPACKECCTGSYPVLQSELNVEELNDRINSTSTVKTEISQNAGRYLCEYIYYLSLSIDSSKSLFVHVPPLDKPYSAEQLAQGLAEIIRNLVAQLRVKDQQTDLQRDQQTASFSSCQVLEMAFGGLGEPLPTMADLDAASERAPQMLFTSPLPPNRDIEEWFDEKVNEMTELLADLLPAHNEDTRCSRNLQIYRENYEEK